MASQYVCIHICFQYLAFVSYFNTELDYKITLQTEINLQDIEVHTQAWVWGFFFTHFRQNDCKMENATVTVRKTGFW